MIGPFRLRWIAPAAGLLVLMLLSWAIFFTPLLTIRSVEVTGAPAGDDAAIVAAADVPPAATMVRVDIARIKQRVSHVPRVASVVVSRRWPTTLLITVTERAAVGVVQAGANYQEIDSAGVLFGVPGKRPAGLALVVAGGAARDAVAEALAELPLTVYSRVDVASAASADSVTFKLRGGAIVVWGSTEQAAAKSAVLTSLLAHVKAHVYDVSAPDLPTTSN